MSMRHVIALVLMLATRLAGAGELEDYAQTLARYRALAAHRFDTKSMPRLEDDDAGPLLSALADRKRFLIPGVFNLDHIDTLHDMCAGAVGVGLSYAFFDMQSVVNKTITDPVQIAARVQMQMRHNIARFQDEFFPLVSFGIACMDKELPVLEQFVAALKPGEFNEARRSGLRQMQNGLFSTFTGLLSSAMTDPVIALDHRIMITGVMADAAPHFAAALPLKERGQILAMARPGQATAPPQMAADMARIVAAMSDGSCKGLCAL